MAWDLADYGVAAGLLAAVAGGITLAFRRSPNASYRFAAAIAVLAAFLLAWINGAVGIIGSENNDANLMYAGVIACLVIGAAVARLRPAGMSRVVFAAAAVQIAVGVVALAGNLGTEGNAWPGDVIVLTAFFALLWLVSGWLFRRAAAASASA
ncbi:MAG: hypothetical protein AAFS02_12250 [Pseudomonadota bacterium]